jgi:NADPH:quinone reductase
MPGLTAYFGLLEVCGVNAGETALGQLAQWVRSGQIRYREDIIEGFENMPRALIGLFRGENLGKRLVKVSEGEN